MLIRRILILASLASLTAWAQPSAPAQPAPIAWRLATGYRAESFQTRNLMLFAEDVQRASLGALQITVHPNNALFKLREIFPAVQAGGIEAGETILTAIAPQVPIAGVDGVPFIVCSYDDARRLWAAQRPLLERQFAARGLRLLYAVPWPPQGLYTHKPIVSTADLKGVRMRTFDPTTLRIAQLVGASPVDVAMVDLRDALAQGSIDAMISSAVTGSETHAWSRMHNYYRINAFFPKNAVFVSSRAFLALPPSVQVAVEKAAQVAEERGWSMSQSQTSSAAADLKAHGMAIERPSAQLQAELKRLGERSTREWLQSVGHEASAVLVPYLVP
ncbi:TRAP-type C4-dicarboxylate transport system substrate-binding protein [Xylophilus ampelinus]|uniref:TRAP-type C4-dicarboxylate transport system substrate-binding protein n=1 Tax=Xylophilus ampelinus TaxID=54067 RepID=A0A318SFC0_9BURK|nr:TRAP-type C4-dicarboxylate transport system substrate-binding protein [Xylophilus ampelinus]